MNRLLIGVMIDEVQCFSQFKKATEKLKKIQIKSSNRKQSKAGFEPVKTRFRKLYSK
jgi:hypothetical protein